MDDRVVMNTRSMAVVITFTALSVAVIPLRIPTVYWPGFYYYWWGIPVVAAFLLFGFKVSSSILVLSTVARMVIGGSQNPLLLPITTIMPYLTTLLGVYLATKFIQR